MTNLTMEGEVQRLLRLLSYENLATPRDRAEDRALANRFLADPATPSCFAWLSIPDFPKDEA